MKTLVAEYNTCQAAIGECSSPVHVDDVLDPDALYQFMHQPCRDLPKSIVKQELIDAYIQAERAAEELELVKNEMTNYLKYYQQKHRVLQKCIESLNARSDAFARGAVSLLRVKTTEINSQCEICEKLFATDDYDSDRESDYDSEEDYNIDI